MEGQNKVGEGIIDEIFSAKLPLLNVNLPFWMYGRNLIFLDAYYMLAETVEKGTWDPITSRNNFVSRNRCFMLMKCIL